VKDYDNIVAGLSALLSIKTECAQLARHRQQLVGDHEGSRNLQPMRRSRSLIAACRGNLPSVVSASGS
jgi:hypothetical protein